MVLFCSSCCRTVEEEQEDLRNVILARQPPQEDQCRGKLLVFINPNSGRGESLKTFLEKVAPKLDKNLIRYEVVITTGRDHAKQVLATKPDLGTFNGVLILSGDGIVFEALNGILSREDGFQMLSTLPFGIIPSGSGNGLLCSILASHGVKLDQETIMKTALEITTSSNATAQSISLLKVKTDSNIITAFLSIGWGIMADIDIESEKWRRTLGAHRFVLGGFVRSFNLRTYQGRLTYRTYKSHGYKTSKQKFKIYEKNAEQRIGELEDNESTSKNWTLHDDFSKSVEDKEEVVIEGEFINVYAVNLSHISADGPFAPSAELEDNRIHLSYILYKDISTRIDMAKYLLAIEHQTHLDLPFVKRVEVSSMKLERLCEGSYVVIDGETVETRTIEVSSTRNKMRVFSP